VEEPQNIFLEVPTQEAQALPHRYLAEDSDRIKTSHDVLGSDLAKIKLAGGIYSFSRGAES
jgi:hypothetical protein